MAFLVLIDSAAGSTTFGLRPRLAGSGFGVLRGSTALAFAGFTAGLALAAGTTLGAGAALALETGLLAAFGAGFATALAAGFTAALGAGFAGTLGAAALTAFAGEALAAGACFLVSVFLTTVESFVAFTVALGETFFPAIDDAPLRLDA
ncbi:MAG TPA: hypothetical protein VFV43_06010 [Limnobacter sp.]|nr:hypothetical protein [Limnobacter sp.]